MDGDILLSANVEAAIPIEAQVPFECFVKTVFSTPYRLTLVVIMRTQVRRAQITLIVINCCC
jgi:hypothetical protein